jgi:hypothetical protein
LATLTPAQETVLIAAREYLRLGLDDLLAVAREFLNPALSRSALHRMLNPAYSRGRPENEDGEWFSLVESGCSWQNTIQEDHSPWVKAYPPGRPPATALSVSS